MKSRVLAFLSRYRQMSFTNAEIAHNAMISGHDVDDLIERMVNDGLVIVDEERVCTVTYCTSIPVRISDAGLLALTYREAA